MCLNVLILTKLQNNKLLLLQVSVYLSDEMLVFWNILYRNVLLEFMFINKLNWPVPIIEVERGSKCVIEENEKRNYDEKNYSNKDVTIDSEKRIFFEKNNKNIEVKRKNIKKNSESCEDSDTDTTNGRIEKKISKNKDIDVTLYPASSLHSPLSLPLSQVQSEKILLPLGGNFFSFFSFFLYQFTLILF